MVYSQKDANTIEGNLFDALVKAGAVSDDNSDEPVSGIIAESTEY
jgi:tRNA U38,U39,U40 pseudouridine synthase TruA